MDYIIKNSGSEDTTIEYRKARDGGFVCNCYIESRDNEKAPALFYQNVNESITPRLNGYAIIPLKKYMELIGEEFDPSSIEEADKQLYT